MVAGNTSLAMSTAATFHATIPSSHAELSALRHDLRAWLGDHEGSDIPSPVDIDVVVTELAANAIDHSAAGSVEVSVTLDDERARIRIANEAGGPTPVLSSEWAEAGERGRGLRLVAALTTGLWLESDDERSVVVAELVADRQPVGET